MNVIVSNENSIVLITISGSIDSKTTADLQSKIMESITDATKVILDMTKVDFVSSAGLRVLLMVYRYIKSQNGKVVLVGVSEEIQDVMEMTGFINFFEMTDTSVNAQKLFN